MFSGIVEAKSKAIKIITRDQVLEVHLEKPSKFNDIKTGDSVAVNGVCLTVEDFTDKSLQFAVAAETLHITGWTEKSLKSQVFNLERSLKMNDRIHGHLVAGHVDGVGQIVEVKNLGESVQLKVKIPESILAYVWKKGSVALNGASLTINELIENCLSVCLIPETLKLTNLSQLQVGDPVNVEVDTMARAMVRAIELGKGARQ